MHANSLFLLQNDSRCGIVPHRHCHDTDGVPMHTRAYTKHTSNGPAAPSASAVLVLSAVFMLFFPIVQPSSQVEELRFVSSGKPCLPFENTGADVPTSPALR